MNDQIFTGEGQLIIRISEGNGSFPVSGAIISVYDRNSNEGGDGLIYSLRSDISGLTEKISLPAPAKSGSLEPGGIQPYSLYDIKVTKNGYRDIELEGVQIFDEITALQVIDMIPLGADTSYHLRTNDPLPHHNGDGTIIFETGEQNL